MTKNAITKFSAAVSLLQNKAESIYELVQKKTQAQRGAKTPTSPSYEPNCGSYAKRDQRTGPTTKTQKVAGLIAGLFITTSVLAQTSPTLVNQSSISAFLTNRVGDCFLTIGMFAIL